MRVSVIGIELVTIDARIVIASVDTYLRFAEAVNRLDLARDPARRIAGAPAGRREDVTEHKIENVEEKVGVRLARGREGRGRGCRGRRRGRRREAPGRQPKGDDDEEDEE